MPTQEGFDVGGTGPVGLVEDAATPPDYPAHVGQEAIGMVGRPGQVVDQDWPMDADFVPEQAGAGELVIERAVWPNPFTGVSFACV
jgi:hypothetical protein